jgi:tetratricopeptide (TPR) repeat protein
LTQVEHDFAAYARQRATELAPGLDWRKPDRLVEVKGRLLGDPDLAWADWAKLHPNNFWVLTRRASEFIEAQRWTEAKTVLERLVQEYPSFTGSDSAYLKLAEVHRALGDTRQERLVLARLTEIDEKAVDACGRLMQLAAEVQDWSTVGQAVRRYLAVNPLVALPYRFLAQASEAQGQTSAGIEACRALLELDPPNPAEVHYDLARLLHRAGEPAARRHVLQALEEAPRYRAALQLLLEIHAAAGGSTTAAVTSPEGKP